jgi:hypothetical protein
MAVESAKPAARLLSIGLRHVEMANNLEYEISVLVGRVALVNQICELRIDFEPTVVNVPSVKVSAFTIWE